MVYSCSWFNRAAAYQGEQAHPLRHWESALKLRNVSPRIAQVQDGSQDLMTLAH